MKGKPLQYSVAPASRYQGDMSRLINAMIKDYEKVFSELNDDFEGFTMDASFASQTRIWLNRLKRKWDKIFKQKSTEIADKFVSQVDIGAKRNLDDSLKQLSGGITIKTPAMPEALKDKIIASTAENVSLIKSIPLQFHQRIEMASLGRQCRTA